MRLASHGSEHRKLEMSCVETAVTRGPPAVTYFEIYADFLTMVTVSIIRSIMSIRLSSVVFSAAVGIRLKSAGTFL